jgi:hypothetical protein
VDRSTNLIAKDREEYRQAAGAVKQGLTADSTLWAVVPIKARMLRDRTRPGLGLSPTTMPTVIDGTVIRGAHAATKNIKFQLTHLVWQFPDIKEIYPGSINVRLDQSLQITSYDYTTLPIPWWDVDATHPGRWVSEIFSFVEIKFEYPQGGTPRSKAPAVRREAEEDWER